MADAPWGAGEDSPMNEGSEYTAASGESVGEQRAGEALADGRADREPPGGGLPLGDDEEAHPEVGEQGGQPNLDPDPPVAGRPSNFAPGTDRRPT
jgi:hypothetical protein